MSIQVDTTHPGILSSYLAESYLRLGRVHNCDMSHKDRKVEEGMAEAGDGETKKLDA